MNLNLTLFIKKICHKSGPVFYTFHKDAEDVVSLYYPLRILLAFPDRPLRSTYRMFVRRLCLLYSTHASKSYRSSIRIPPSIFSLSKYLACVA